MSGTERLDEILEPEVREACRRYRMEPERALEILRETFLADERLVARLVDRHGKEDVTRWRSYREAVRTARKHIYYELRRFQRSGAELQQAIHELARAVARGQNGPIEAARRRLVELHVSTRERETVSERLQQEILRSIPDPRSILDVGCGLHPLQWLAPGRPGRPRLYLAVDRDAESIQAVEAYAPAARPTRLVSRRMEIARLGDESLGRQFDLGLVMKVAAQIRRQERNVFPVLRTLPCRYLVLTESAVSLTRRCSIQRRERKVLDRYLETSTRPVLHQIELSTEIGLVLGPPEGLRSRSS